VRLGQGMRLPSRHWYIMPHRSIEDTIRSGVPLGMCLLPRTRFF
jgi:hypothetical protein